MRLLEKLTPQEKDLQERELRMKNLLSLAEDVMAIREKVVEIRGKQKVYDPFFKQFTQNLKIITNDLMIESKKLSNQSLDNVVNLLAKMQPVK